MCSVRIIQIIMINAAQNDLTDACVYDWYGIYHLPLVMEGFLIGRCPFVPVGRATGGITQFCFRK